MSAGYFRRGRGVPAGPGGGGRRLRLRGPRRRAAAPRAGRVCKRSSSNTPARKPAWVRLAEGGEISGGAAGVPALLPLLVKPLKKKLRGPAAKENSLNIHGNSRKIAKFRDISQYFANFRGPRARPGGGGLGGAGRRRAAALRAGRANARVREQSAWCKRPNVRAFKPARAGPGPGPGPGRESARPGRARVLLTLTPGCLGAEQASPGPGRGPRS